MGSVIIYIGTPYWLLSTDSSSMIPHIGDGIYMSNYVSTAIPMGISLMCDKEWKHK